MNTPTLHRHKHRPHARPTPPEAVRDIRRRVEAGEKHDSIAHDYGITQPAVSQIASGKRRREVV